MRISKDLSIVGAFLRWGGLITVVLAIMGGILGMHVVNGTPAAPMGHSGTSVAVVADGMASQTADGHLASSTDHFPDAEVLGHPYSAPACGCSPTDCTSSMAMHEDCTPNLSSTMLNVPLPGLLSTQAAGTAFVPVPGYKAADRIPEPPSLKKLSISRT